MQQRSAVDPRDVLRGEPLPVHRDLGVVVLYLAQIVSRQGHVEAPRFLPDGQFAGCRETARARVFEGSSSPFFACAFRLTGVLMSQRYDFIN